MNTWSVYTNVKRTVHSAIHYANVCIWERHHQQAKQTTNKNTTNKRARVLLQPIETGILQQPTSNTWFAKVQIECCTHYSQPSLSADSDTGKARQDTTNGMSIIVCLKLCTRHWCSRLPCLVRYFASMTRDAMEVVWGHFGRHIVIDWNIHVRSAKTLELRW
jgi:hypothetical protein